MRFLEQLYATSRKVHEVRGPFLQSIKDMRGLEFSALRCNTSLWRSSACLSRFDTHTQDRLATNISNQDTDLHILRSCPASHNPL